MAYKMKAVGPGISRGGVHDFSVNHPFGHDTQWKQLRRDTQCREDVYVGESPPDDYPSKQSLPRLSKTHLPMSITLRTCLIVDRFSTVLA